MTVGFDWAIVLFKSSISLLIFCLILLSSVENGVLKSPITTVELSFSLLNFFSFYLVYF